MKGGKLMHHKPNIPALREFSLYKKTDMYKNAGFFLRFYINFLWVLKYNKITPNRVTWFRLELWGALVVAWLYIIHVSHRFEFLLILILISIPIWLLDRVDGDLARYTDQITESGAELDPFVDKIMIYSGYLILSIDLFYPRLIALFLISLILDLTSTYLRSYQPVGKKGAISWGKYKLTSQVISSIFLALAVYLGLCCSQIFEPIMVLIGFIFLIISIVMSMVSLSVKIYDFKKEEALSWPLFFFVKNSSNHSYYEK